MGQYYIAVSKERREFIHPHRFGDGLKFREFCGSSHGFLAGLALLLRKTDDPVPEDAIVGSWAGSDLTIVGDYDSGGLYGAAYSEYKDVSFDVIRVMVKDSHAKECMSHRLEFHRLEGWGSLMASPEEQDFYREVFNGSE
jgi:hypothetical protein